jgi:hypothetical protein
VKMENREEKNINIAGWGTDIDPDNEPTYPMKKYTGDDHNRLNYERPPQQHSDVEVLHSNERPGLSAVYGTTIPPKGLSGAIRRFAFKYSEGSFGHWLPLLFADRVNQVEGLIEDIGSGHIPNIFKEMGWKAAWKYNRKGLIKKIGIAAGVTATVIFLFTRKK